MSEAAEVIETDTSTVDPLEGGHVVGSTILAPQTAADFIRVHGLTDAELEGFTGLQDGTETVSDGGDEPIERVQQQDDSSVEVSHEYDVGGLSIADDPVAHELLNAAHDRGLSADDVQALAQVWEKGLQKNAELQAPAWAAFDRDNEEKVHADLAKMYGANAGRIWNEALEAQHTMPGGLFEFLATSRRPDGVGWLHDAEVVEWLAKASQAMRKR